MFNSHPPTHAPQSRALAPPNHSHPKLFASPLAFDSAIACGRAASLVYDVV